MKINSLARAGKITPFPGACSVHSKNLSFGRAFILSRKAGKTKTALFER